MKYDLQDVALSKVMVWDEAQARNLDKNDLDSLARSIEQDGLQNPPLLQKNNDGTYLLISGQRRLAAFAKLGKKTIPALVLNSAKSVDSAKATSLIENFHRNKMSAGDISRAVKFIVSSKGKKEARKILGISERTLARYMGFDAVPPQIQELVPGIISKDHAIKACQYARNAADTLEIIHIISKYDEPKKERYLKALSQNPNDSHEQLLRKSHQFHSSKFTLDLSESQIQRLTNLAQKKETTPDNLVTEIILRYLAR
jgi:ParB family transcriptional regulator, chromosome partitioning protein